MYVCIRIEKSTCYLLCLKPIFITRFFFLYSPTNIFFRAIWKWLIAKHQIYSMCYAFHWVHDIDNKALLRTIYYNLLTCHCYRTNTMCFLYCLMCLITKVYTRHAPHLVIFWIVCFPSHRIHFFSNVKRVLKFSRGKNNK